MLRIQGLQKECIAKYLPGRLGLVYEWFSYTAVEDVTILIELFVKILDLCGYQVTISWIVYVPLPIHMDHL